MSSNVTFSSASTLDSRPQSAIARRALIQCQYTVPDSVNVSAHLCAENTRHTNYIRHAPCRVDIGRSRNAAVAYWRRRNVMRPSSAASNRHGGTTSPSNVTSLPSLSNRDDSDVVGGDEYVVRVSQNWGWKAPKDPDVVSSLSNPPMQHAEVTLSNGIRTTIDRAHQHIHFTFPGVAADVQETQQMSPHVESTTNTADDTATPPSPNRSVQQNGSSTQRARGALRQNKAALSAADIFADLENRKATGRCASSLPPRDDEDSRLLQKFGYR